MQSLSLTCINQPMVHKISIQLSKQLNKARESCVLTTVIYTKLSIKVIEVYSLPCISLIMHHDVVSLSIRCEMYSSHSGQFY